MADLRLRAGFGGGKGLDLKLARDAGVRVPETFSFFPDEVYSQLLSFSGLSKAIESWCKWSPTVEENLKAVRAEILSMAPPKYWSEDFKTLSNAFSKSNPSKWIVRSSMNVENLGQASFAGAYESIPVFNPTAESFWKAALEVIASGFSISAARQLLANGLDPRDFKPGAIVQAFVPGKISGVCFSRNPKTPWVLSPLAEWIEGSAEDVVQGTRKSALILEGESHAMLPFLPELFKIASEMETIFSRSVDLEWTHDGEKLWILQVRPVVGLSSELAPFTSDRHWNRELARERFPEKISKLGWTAIEDLIPSNLASLEKDFGLIADPSSPITIQYQGIIYSDPDYFKFPGRVRIKLLRYINPFSAHFYKILRSILSAFGRKLRRINQLISSGLLKMDLVDAAVGPQARKLHARWNEHVISGKKIVGALRQKSESAALDAAELLSIMEEIRALSVEFLAPDLPIYVIKDSMNKALESFWSAFGHPSKELAWAMSSFENNQTMNVGQKWDELASLAKKDVVAARAEWELFLKDNGHMRTSWDLARPNWREQKEAIWSLIAETNPSSKGRDLKETASARLLAWKKEMSTSGLNEREISRISRFIELQKTFMRLDEELHFLSGLLLEPSRILVLKSARLLSDLGLIEAPEDIFYLGLGELKALLKDPSVSKKFLIERRKSEEKHWPKVSPEILPPPKDDTLSSFHSKIQPASPGQASGPVFFVEHLEEASKVPNGAILVTTAPNPSFIPLYPRLAGIATVTGGMLSHGFVAAREYGIPAISGLENSENHQDGDWLEIDGTLGSANWKTSL